MHIDDLPGMVGATGRMEVVLRLDLESVKVLLARSENNNKSACHAECLSTSTRCDARPYNLLSQADWTADS